METEGTTFALTRITGWSHLPFDKNFEETFAS